MFFLPLFDDNPSHRSPYVSWTILALCVLVFFWQTSINAYDERLAFYTYGFVPALLSGDVMLPAEIAIIPAWATIITSMFLHGGFLHVGGNMLYLWIFGDNVEDSMGPARFVVFYLLCGAAAALAQFAINPASSVPMVGASGGIAGILGAYVLLHPKAAIRTIIVVIVFIRFINLPAWLILGVWIAGQFVAVPAALSETSGGGGVAYFAHIGGFIAGMALIPFFKRRDVPLFGANDTTPKRWTSEPVPFSQIRQQAHNKYSRRQNDPLGSRIVTKPPAARKGGGSVPKHRRPD